MHFVNKQMCTGKRSAKHVSLFINQHAGEIKMPQENAHCARVTGNGIPGCLLFFRGIFHTSFTHLTPENVALTFTTTWHLRYHRFRQGYAPSSFHNIPWVQSYHYLQFSMQTLPCLQFLQSSVWSWCVFTSVWNRVNTTKVYIFFPGKLRYVYHQG